MCVLKNIKILSGNAWFLGREKLNKIVALYLHIFMGFWLNIIKINIWFYDNKKSFLVTNSSKIKHGLNRNEKPLLNIQKYF